MPQTGTNPAVMTSSSRTSEPRAVRRGLREAVLLATLALLTCVTAIVSSLGAPLVPAIADSYGVGLASAQWILTAALLSGAVAADASGLWHAPALDVAVVNPAGAGDAMVAAMAMGAERGEATPRVLASAVALASAVVITERTAECRRPDYERLLTLVSVESLPQ